MCVAIPGRVVEVHEGIGLERTATIDVRGSRREVCLGLTPDAQVGDHVITHSGYALRIVPAEPIPQPMLGRVDQKRRL